MLIYKIIKHESLRTRRSSVRNTFRELLSPKFTLINNGPPKSMLCLLKAFKAPYREFGDPELKNPPPNNASYILLPLSTQKLDLSIRKVNP